LENLIKNTAPLRKGKRPLLKSLSFDDTIIAGSGDEFRRMFRGYLAENGIDPKKLTEGNPEVWGNVWRDACIYNCRARCRSSSPESRIGLLER
jgi:hypothetical protein